MKAEIEICDVCGIKLEYNDSYVLSLNKKYDYPPIDSELLTMCGKCRKEYLNNIKKLNKKRIKWVVE